MQGVHSGFSSQSSEVYYNTVLEKAFKLVVDRMTNIIQSPEQLTDTSEEKKWAKKVRKCYKALLMMEKHKTVGPWFSSLFSVIQGVLKDKYFEKEVTQESDGPSSEVSFTFHNTLTREPRLEVIQDEQKPKNGKPPLSMREKPHIV